MLLLTLVKVVSLKTFSIWIFFYINIFVLGFVNMVFLTNRNVLTFLMACEVSYFSISLGFAMHGFDSGVFSGLIYGILVLVAAVSESAVGLGLISYLTRYNGTIELDNLDLMGKRN